jgi:hypothetical protein
VCKGGFRIKKLETVVLPLMTTKHPFFACQLLPPLLLYPSLLLSLCFFIAITSEAQNELIKLSFSFSFPF